MNLNNNFSWLRTNKQIICLKSLSKFSIFSFSNFSFLFQLFLSFSNFSFPTFLFFLSFFSSFFFLLDNHLRQKFINKGNVNTNSLAKLRNLVILPFVCSAIYISNHAPSLISGNLMRESYSRRCSKLWQVSWHWKNRLHIYRVIQKQRPILVFI